MFTIKLAIFNTLCFCDAVTIYGCYSGILNNYSTSARWIWDDR